MEVDDIKKFFPTYLTDTKKAELAEALEKFNASTSPLYTTHDTGDLLQGDVWSGLEIIEFESASRRWIHGIVLSNSCDVDDENARHLPPSLIIAPLVKLSQLERLLLENGIAASVVESKVKAMEKQQITSVFYLPTAFCLHEPHVILLDQVHSIPLNKFKEKKDTKRHFSLNMLGFYLFIFKLSMHFCRLHENVDRPVRP